MPECLKGLKKKERERKDKGEEKYLVSLFPNKQPVAHSVKTSS